MTNPFVHVELHTPDLPKAKDFYTRLFGWKLQDEPMPGGEGSYTMIDVAGGSGSSSADNTAGGSGGGIGGGMCGLAGPDETPHWLAYVGVDDLRAMTDKARELGATICVDSMEIGTFGALSVLLDPTGAKLALWQCKTPAPQE